MKLESPKVKAGKGQQEMFAYLTNVENYDELMPESKEKFQAISQDTFLFQLKGMPEIRLKIKETKEPELIVLGSTSDKFPFNLNIHIAEDQANSSEVFLDFEGNFNPMMSMMIKGPLKKFINTLSENIAKK
ncbi:orotate phosphoribosyltransferase [Christiangramia salexigens]|uniref:Orotate phosphoribosyltransferase n=1 Tax=Christiangramia salexigens TaxID=1913577 RepID=A0A1L3J861_9FLAO|nr:orotate phosphoribosyltransferase [Christiangramia salexigens]APG61293.1 orotate phosphoribosyltransferase [Christiangramia salexigens]